MAKIGKTNGKTRVGRGKAAGTAEKTVVSPDGVKPFSVPGFLFPETALPEYERIEGPPLYSIEYYRNVLKKDFNDSIDLKIKEYVIFDGRKILLCYFGTMAANAALLNEILRCFLDAKLSTVKHEYDDIVAYCHDNIIAAAETEIAEERGTAREAVMRGDCAVFFEGEQRAIIVAIKGYSGRSVQEPPNGTVVRGPREGFTEDLLTNLALLRKRIHSEKLVFDHMEVGRYTKTKVVLSYLSDIADPKIINELKQKIAAIDIDAVHDSSYIQKFLEKSPYSLFKQIGATEKSDIAAAKMMEGRIAIVVDNSPMVLTVPFLLFENFQDSGDYYARKHKSDYARLLRILSILLAVCLPALHVAVLTHDYHVVPLKYLIAVINSTVNTPVSPLAEMLIVLFLFDLLHEASARMPRSIGLALNIVGALVLGDTAVKAGILSPPSVIVGAVSGIGLFAVPEQGASFSLLRIVFLIVSDFLGLQGLLFCLMFLTVYFVSIDNFRTPYLAPFAPFIKKDLADGILREELNEARERPYSIPNKNRRKLK